MLSKLIPKRMYGLMYITSNIMEKENRVEYDIKPSDNLVKKDIKQNNNCFNDNILISFDSKRINQIKRPMYQNSSNQYNFKIKSNEFQILKHLININDKYLTNNDIHLHTNLENVNYDDIPIVIYYSILQEALYADSDNINNPFNLYKKIRSIVDTLDLDPAVMQDVEKDLKIISHVFYRLFITAVKYKILDKVDEENLIRTIRNSFCHDNYFSMARADGMNITFIEKLKASLSYGAQQKLNQLEKDDLVISIMNDRKKVKFCCIIKIKDFETVAHKFKNMCKQIIVKSKQQPQSDRAKTFNNLKEAQLLRYIHQADKSSPYSPSFRK